MKVTYQWLKEFADVKTDPEKLSQELSMAGLSVASLERSGDDWVYDIEVTSNRPDWLSVRGIASEVAAITGAKVKKLDAGRRPAERGKAGRAEGKVYRGVPGFSIKVEDAKDCSLYCAALITGVKVAPSPAWLKKRLEAVGFRSLNNVVDITNYCLMEFGQPLHAFDFGKISQSSIVVRRARETERLVLIDGSEKELSRQVLVIADSARPMAVAGIMGGRDTEVGETTKNILLESACFDPVVVRRGARALGVASESSYRFERGVDVPTVSLALERAAAMICELCGGTLVSSKASAKRQKPEGRKISFSVSSIRDVLSIDISGGKIKTILEKLKFGVRRKTADIYEASVPSHRRDVRIPQDITEEIARIYGYNRIPLTKPSIKPFFLDVPPVQVVTPKLRRLLTGMGLKEVITYSLISDDDYKNSAIREAGPALTLDNPLSEDYSILRATVIPSLLKCVAFNVNHNNRDLEIFEVSRVFSGNAEPVSLGIALCGAKRETWLKESRPYTFFDLKGILETLLQELRIKKYEIMETGEGFSEKGMACHVVVAGKTAASFGKVSQEVKRAWSIKGKEDIFIAEVSVDALAELADLKKRYREIASTPSVLRDISVISPRTVSYAKIKGLIEQRAEGYLANVAFVDRYQGPEIPAGQTGLTVSVEYGLAQKTLTDEEVNGIHQKVLRGLVDELGLKLR